MGVVKKGVPSNSMNNLRHCGWGPRLGVGPGLGTCPKSNSKDMHMHGPVVSDVGRGGQFESECPECVREVLRLASTFARYTAFAFRQGKRPGREDKLLKAS